MSSLSVKPPSRNLKGMTFGRMTVLEFAGRNKYHYALWRCLCSCGLEKIVVGGSLTSGLTKSCGCLKREVISKLYRRHGRSNTRAHRIWSGIRRRCNNKNSTCWKYYGSRGIRVCARWQSFENFLADMGDPPPKHTIERKNNDGMYSCGKCDDCAANGWPANCVWATVKAQARNKRDNHRVTLNGTTLTLVEWGELLGINPATLRHRLKKGWSEERALTTPVRRRPRRQPR